VNKVHLSQPDLQNASAATLGMTAPISSGLLSTSQIDGSGGDQIPRICPECKDTKSVFKTKSQTWLKNFARLFGVSTETLWRCTRCGWSAPLSPNWEPAIADPFHRPPPTVEQNPLFRTAETWHRPPSSLLVDYSMQQPPAQLSHPAGTH